MSRRKILMIVAAAFGGAAAGNPADAQSVAGTWELVQVGSNALPAVLETEGDCREEIVSAVLTLNANNTWDLEWTERDVCGTKTEEEREEENGRYRVTGSSIELLDDDGKAQSDKSGDDLDDVSTGTVHNNTITVRLGKTQTTATFRKR